MFLIRTWLEANLCRRGSGAVFLSDVSTRSALGLKHIPIIIGKFVLAVYWMGEGYQVSALSAV